jgi:hypothetical protein
MHGSNTRCARLATAGWLAIAAMAPAPSGAADWSDTALGYRYGTQYREPFNPEDITKNILSLTHASGYKYGSNFFDVDMLRSAHNDPASGGGGGAHEVYTVYRTTLSLSKAFGIATKHGVIRDIGVTAGFDFNAKDDPFSARVFKTALGPKVSFDVPGFFDVAVVWLTEHNHNWFASPPGFGGAGCVESPEQTCNADVHFKDTAGIEAAWLIPFSLGLPAKVQGFLEYVGEKGKDGTGAQTRPETLFEIALLWDVGSAMGHKDAIFAGVGYQYWKNKFGSDSALDPTGGSTARVPQLELEWHF